MADAPNPITSPPNVPGQPYDATGEGSIGKWEKIPDGGAADRAGNIAGGWSDNGASSGGDWEQT